jgi:imidazolonepropionase-like amidohydrolase
VSTCLTSQVAQSQATPARIAIVGVTVVDVSTGRLLRDHTVVVSEGRIAAVGPRQGRGAVRVRAGARVVDGKGKYLIPGLWDMHVHALPSDRRPKTVDTFFPLFVANGVTGVRDMGGNLDTLLAIRTRRALMAPRLVAAGPLVDGPRPTFPELSVSVATPAAASGSVDSLVTAGVDFIKVYSRLPRETYAAIVAAARRRGLPVAGHVPIELSVSEASNAGQASVEHLAEIILDCSSEAGDIRRQFVAAMQGAPAGSTDLTRARRAARARALRTVDWPTCRSLFAELARNGTWVVPTLAVGANVADTSRAHDARLRYFDASTVAAWRSDAPATPASGRAPNDSSAPRPAPLADVAPYARELVRAGVGLLAGTDLPNFYTFPGFDLHAELALLVEAGLTPLQALQAATLNPARFLAATDSLGSVAPGKLADLVLLDADPLGDIRNTTAIRAVFANGRFLDRAALDSLLVGAERVARVQ